MFCCSKGADSVVQAWLPPHRLAPPLTTGLPFPHPGVLQMGGTDGVYQRLLLPCVVPGLGRRVLRRWCSAHGRHPAGPHAHHRSHVLVDQGAALLMCQAAVSGRYVTIIIYI